MDRVLLHGVLLYYTMDKRHKFDVCMITRPRMLLIAESFF